MPPQDSEIEPDVVDGHLVAPEPLDGFAEGLYRIARIVEKIEAVYGDDAYEALIHWKQDGVLPEEIEIPA